MPFRTEGSHSYARDSFSTPELSDLLCRKTQVSHVFSRGCCSEHASTLASPWLDLAEDRLRLDRLSRNAGGSTFFPWAQAHSSRGQESPSAAILRCAPARGAGASSIASGLPIAIEAAVVAGSKQQGEVTWPTSVPSRRSGSEFQGEIVTLSLQAKGVRIVPEASRGNDNAPSHRVYRRPVEIGAAWSKRSNEGRDYLSLKLDDPSFNAPIYANLFDDEEATATP